MLRDLSALPVFDRAKALGYLEGDESLLDEVIQIFQDTAAGMLSNLDAAIGGGDSAAVQSAAHAIKGGAANICAERIGCIAKHLEECAAAGNRKEFAALAATLHAEYERLAAVLGLDRQT